MSYKNKTYISFDGDNDIQYYRVMKAWKANEYIDFEFYDAHDLNTARDTSNEASIKAQLSERFRNAKIFLILVGDNTRYLYKFVRWEIEQAISRELPIIVVNLNGKKSMDDELCPPILRKTLAIHIPFKAKIIQYAINNWIDSEKNLKLKGENGPYYYKNDLYYELGL